MESADVAKGLPHPGLRPIVRQYVGYRTEGIFPGVHRGLPSGYLTFLISIGRPIETLSVPAGSHLPPSLQALVGGLQTGPTMVCSGGDEKGIAVELTPGVRRPCSGFRRSS